MWVGGWAQGWVKGWGPGRPLQHLLLSYWICAQRGRGEGTAGEPVPFACDVLVADVDKPNLLSGQGMVHAQPAAAAVAVLRQVPRLKVEEQAGVFPLLSSRGYRTVEGVWDCRQEPPRSLQRFLGAAFYGRPTATASFDDGSVAERTELPRRLLGFWTAVQWAIISCPPSARSLKKGEMK